MRCLGEAELIRVDFTEVNVNLCGMDLRRKKLALALRIMTVGMAVAWGWHSWQGLVLHRGYPYNSFLSIPSNRFGDLTQVMGSSKLPSPYQNTQAGYLPSAYIVFRCLGHMVSNAGAILFCLGMTWLGLWALLILVLRDIFAESKVRLRSVLGPILAATALMLSSYPVWSAMDRANLEFIMALLMALALVCFRRKKFYLGLSFLLPTICFKLYPILMLALFVRPRHVLKVIIAGFSFAVINLLSFVSFSGSMASNLQLWNRNLTFCKSYFLIQNGCLGSGASPWATCKVLMMTLGCALAGFPQGATIVLSEIFLEHLYSVFMWLSLVGILLGVIFAIWIETEFFRRSIVLLIILTLCVPYGGDYRLLYMNIALVVLILLPTRRSYDFLCVGLLAFVAVPKHEVMLWYLGNVGPGINYISLSVLTDAPCMLVALLLLIRNGCPNLWWTHFRVKIVRDFKATKYRLQKLKFAHG